MSEFRFSRGILALAVTLVVPAVARAADNAANSGKARYTKQETEVTAKQTNLTKPEAPPPPKKETGPVLTVDQFVAVKQEGIMKLVDAQISKMRRLIQVTGDDDPQKPDFLFRLGELYGEKQHYNFGKARALDQKIYEMPPNQRGNLLNEQKRYEAEQQKWLLEAVKSFIGATKFRKYERMDEVLFRLAFLLTSVKKEDQAREFFHRLIKD